MAWQIDTTNENEFRPRMELHPDDEALYWQMVDDVKRARGLWGITNIGIPFGFVFPLPDHPLRLRVISDHRNLPTFLSARIGWAIPQKVIDAIEALEPGVHRYWPVEITMKDGSKAEPRWLLNICNRLETISPEHSDVTVVGGKPERASYVPNFSTLTVKHNGDGPKYVTCRKDRIGTHAAWYEFRYGEIFFSNALMNSLRQIGTDGLEFWLETAEI